MIDFSTIEFTLNDLESRYNATNEVVVQVYCSKLAVLEFGGWVEETIDGIVRQYISNKGISNKYLKDFIEKRISDTYGFKFDLVSYLFCLTLGAKSWEKLIVELDNMQYLDQFKCILNDFTKKRNDAAHKNISQMTTYEAPSTILNNFKKIKPIMQHIDNYIGTL